MYEADARVLIYNPAERRFACGPTSFPRYLFSDYIPKVQEAWSACLEGRFNCPSFLAIHSTLGIGLVTESYTRRGNLKSMVEQIDSELKIETPAD